VPWLLHRWSTGGQHQIFQVMTNFALYDTIAIRYELARPSPITTIALYLLQMFLFYLVIRCIHSWRRLQISQGGVKWGWCEFLQTNWLDLTTELDIGEYNNEVNIAVKVRYLCSDSFMLGGSRFELPLNWIVGLPLTVSGVTLLVGKHTPVIGQTCWWHNQSGVEVGTGQWDKLL